VFCDSVVASGDQESTHCVWHRFWRHSTTCVRLERHDMMLHAVCGFYCQMGLTIKGLVDFEGLWSHTEARRKVRLLNALLGTLREKAILSQLLCSLLDERCANRRFNRPPDHLVCFSLRNSLSVYRLLEIQCAVFDPQTETMLTSLDC